MTKLVIAGSRDIDEGHACYILDDQLGNLHWNISEIVSGGARGPDSAAAYFADRHRIKLTEFLPDWETHGKKAGPLRNIQMAEYGDKLLALWDGKSRGTRHMIDAMLDRGKEVTVLIIETIERESKG